MRGLPILPGLLIPVKSVSYKLPLEIKDINENTMKTLLFFCLTMFSVAIAGAQNLQLHYNLDEDGAYFTSTVEMFRPDKWGSTFFFIDMDYNVAGIKGISLAYWEIARAIKPGDFPFAFHVEYNGGLGQYEADNIAKAFTIEDAWLCGIEHSWNAADYSRGLTLQGLYKYIRGKHDASFQLTAVWYWDLFNNRLSFTGFADWWREDFIIEGEKTKFVFLAEPQIWYNFNKNFAIGSEIELSSNVYNSDILHVMPTIGAKVSF